jgi:PadR family transcriptional regulator AphA
MPSGAVNSRYFILGLLARQPMSGYDIKRFFKSLTWLIGSPSFGSIYPALRALLQDDLVTVAVVSRQDKPPRKIYSITETGREALREWIDQPVAPGASLKVFVLRLILADNFSHAGLVSHLHRRRSQVAAHRTDLERTIALLGDGAELGRHLALDYSLAVAKAELAWLDDTLDRLSKESFSVEVAESSHAAGMA